MFAHSEAERAAWTAERDRRVREQQGAYGQQQSPYGFQAQEAYPPQYAQAVPEYAAVAQPQYYVAAAPQYAPAQVVGGFAPAAMSSGPVAALESQLKAAIAATDFIQCAQLQAQIKQLKAQEAGPSPVVQALEQKLKAALAAQDFVLCAQYKAELDGLKGSAGAAQGMAPQVMVPRQQADGMYFQQQDPYQQAQTAYQQQAVYQQQAFQPQQQQSSGVIRPCPQKTMQSRLESGKTFFMCKTIREGGDCRYGDSCGYAHSEAEKSAWTVQRDQMLGMSSY